MDRFLKTFNISLHSFLEYLPALLGGIVCFIVTIFVANFLSRIASKYSKRRTKDSLIANFIGKIIWAIIFILGTVLSLGLLGLGTISNKILAGAGITTFIVGFALKDIGENFLAGIILAFSRPYHQGSLIECNNIKGVVKDMSMRQTTVEAENGKIILIPNSNIINNPLIKYVNSDFNIRQEFSLNIEHGNARKSLDLIEQTIESFDSVSREKNKSVKAIVHSASSEMIKITVVFWFDTAKLTSRTDMKSEIMLAVFDKLREAGYKFSG
jgi:small-conductance mechanosensitive channel